MAHGLPVLLLTPLLICLRSLYFIITPTWMDFRMYNITTAVRSTPLLASGAVDHIPPLQPQDPNVRGMSVYFMTASQTCFSCMFFGFLYVTFPRIAPRLVGTFGPPEWDFPKSTAAFMGSLSGSGLIIFVNAMSSSRTPPYLQSLLVNSLIPVQFVIRFILLRKRPTIFKVVCALVIIITEFICLLPTIFPQLESKSARHDDGGASGPGAVLWPLCMIASMIPFAVTNTLTEYSVQKKSDSTPVTINVNSEEEPLISDSSTDQSELSATASDQSGPRAKEDEACNTSGSHASSSSTSGSGGTKQRQINLIYFQFWFSLFVFLTCLSFFWCDIIPGFGTSSSLQELYEKFIFDAGCLVGYSGCSWKVAALGWSNYLVAALAAISLPALMRYSEGANFVVVALTLRTPIVLIFWSLFEEPPLRWHPHAHLGTWLSIGAIFFMIPAVVLYESGEDLWAKHCRPRLSQRHVPNTDKDDDDDRLLATGGEEHNIQDGSTPPCGTPDDDNLLC